MCYFFFQNKNFSENQYDRKTYGLVSQTKLSHTFPLHHGPHRWRIPIRQCPPWQGTRAINWVVWPHPLSHIFKTTEGPLVPRTHWEEQVRQVLPLWRLHSTSIPIMSTGRCWPTENDGLCSCHRERERTAQQPYDKRFSQSIAQTGMPAFGGVGEKMRRSPTISELGKSLPGSRSEIRGSGSNSSVRWGGGEAHLAVAREQDEVWGLHRFYSRSEQRPQKCMQCIWPWPPFLPRYFWSPVPSDNSKNRTPCT